jgi:GR25 family glycosyltransferase involved in LPS biosynthesis
LQFEEMDAQLYIESPYVPRSMKQADEIWCWDILNPVETIPSIQTLFPCPIKRVPFIWSPTVVEHYCKEVYCIVPTASRTIHIAEKNTNSSSSILSLVALRELSRKYTTDTYKVHNMNHLKENKFLKENVLMPIEADTLPLVFAEKEPWYQWMQNDIILSHSRFTPLRIGLLHAIWLQIPLIHNSPFLRDLDPHLQRTYYEGNSIQGIIDAFSRMDPSLSVDRSVFDSISIDRKKAEWQVLLHTDQPTIVHHMPTDDTSPLLIAFDDMWPGFNYDTNFIMDALRKEQPHRSIKGQRYSSMHTPNLLIFGPYSQNWKTIDVPKVYFSGENWPHPTDPSIALYLSSSTVEDATHMRVPTWMHFIDWYNNTMELPTNHEDNPIRMPLAYAMNPHPVSFEQRKKFCAFVVSNPVCSLRNDAFHQLNQYKPVSSGGAYQNNIGGQLQLKYPGGGCGDISKHHFFAEHQFTISFENSQSPGYVTEKLLHAKMAGCVPLYWGDPTCSGKNAEFNPNSFIALSHMTSAAGIVEVMKKLEANPAICQTIAATPLLDESRKQIALNTISAMSRRILQIASAPVQSTPPPVTNPIDTIYLINLDTRQDRLHTFQAAHSNFSYTRISAVYGKQLEMSEVLYTLCKQNTFQWKKSVIACALSHISVWNTIASQAATYTLVLEDDVRMIPEWKTYIADIPADAELLYLGGVLPTNRHVLPQALEKINEYWSQLKPNTFFTKEPMAHFHFCAYSYILTKQGAQKLLDYLTHSHDKLCIPIDHLLGHPVIGLKKYIANKMITTCFQEEDQQYNQAEFNELQTEKKFDSDIYNNTECFDVSGYQNIVVPSIAASPVSPASPALVPSVPIYYMSKDKPILYEQIWLEDMFQRSIDFQPFQMKLPACTVCLVQRPYVDAWNNIFAIFEKQQIPFYVLHLSDEHGTDKIDFYSLQMCKHVIRNYIRPNMINEKVTIIPLGYHHKPTHQPPFAIRKLVWSFHGTDWFNRGEQLGQLVSYTPHHCKLQKQWNDPTKTKEKEYLADLTNSMFCPILRGNHMETFRIYEALEAGALPIAMEANEYTRWIDEHLQLSDLYRWTEPTIMEQLRSVERIDEIQNNVMSRWSRWKERVQLAIQCITQPK